MENVHGIEHVKKALKFVIDLAESVENKLSDGKINFVESVSLVVQLSPVPGIIQDRAKLLQEIKDLNEVETDELIDFIVSEYNTPKENVHDIIANAIEFAGSIYNIVKLIKK